MRLFAAIRTSNAINAAVKNAANSLSLFGSGSFCGEDMYHVTLAFIGESNRAEEIARALDGVKFKPFTLSTGDLGSFGSTFYVSVEKSAPLAALQRAVVDALLSVGVKTETRPFKPHITVARRFKQRSAPAVFVPRAEMEANEIALMESKNGSYYTLSVFKGV